MRDFSWWPFSTDGMGLCTAQTLSYSVEGCRGGIPVAQLPFGGESTSVVSLSPFDRSEACGSIKGIPCTGQSSMPPKRATSVCGTECCGFCVTLAWFLRRRWRRQLGACSDLIRPLHRAVLCALCVFVPPRPSGWLAGTVGVRWRRAR